MRIAAGLLICLIAAAAAAAPAAARDRELLVVQANVGNSNVAGCADQVFKLCLRPVEERGARSLRELAPDVVTFQEILPPELCERAPSANPFNLCSAPLEPRSQVTRLLGPGYDQRCDDRFGWDCVAVRPARAELAGHATRPVLAECGDRGFALNAGTIRVGGWPLAITNAHPHSTDVACRTAQLRDLFEDALPAAGPALVLGDFNLDPYREEDESVRYWRTQVPGRFRPVSTDAFTFALGPSQLDPTGQVLDAGADLVARRTLDHVLVRDGLTGGCEPRRIDGGGGMDHLAQVCRITVGPEAAPGFRLRTRRCTVTARFAPRPSHLERVAFTTGARRTVVGGPPYRLRTAPARRARRVVATPLLATGAGPERETTVPARCAGAASGPKRPRGPGSRRPRFPG